MIARRARACALLAVVATSGAAPASADSLRGWSSNHCIGSFTPPAALAMAGDRPVAFGRANVADVFGAGVGAPDYAVQKFCHIDADVVGAVADVQEATFDVATPRSIDRVHLLTDGGTYVPDTIAPPLGTSDRVETVACNAQGQIAVAISTNGDAAAPRFLLYDRLATGAAKPIRDFTSTRVTSAVSALAFDARGELYVYDDAGEIVEFASNASGLNPESRRRIAGPATLLRPAIAGPHGKRALAIDRDGYITAADDRFVMTFAKEADGDTTPFDTLESRDRVYGLGTDARGYLYVLRANLQGDNPTTSVRIFEAAADRVKSDLDEKPLKEEVVST